MTKDIIGNRLKIEDKSGLMFASNLSEIIYSIDKINKYIQNKEIEFLVVILEGKENDVTDRSELQRLFVWMERLEVPSVAVIDESCYGEYLEFVMMCDICIGGKNLSLNFPDDISSFSFDFKKRCQTLMGLEDYNGSKNFLGRRLDIEELMDLRIVNHVIDRGCVVEEVKKYIKKLQNNKSSNQIRAIMKCFNSYKHHGLDTNRELLLEEESRQFCGLIMQEYKKSGMQNED